VAVLNKLHPTSKFLSCVSQYALNGARNIQITSYPLFLLNCKFCIILCSGECIAIKVFTWKNGHKKLFLELAHFYCLLDLSAALFGGRLLYFKAQQHKMCSGLRRISFLAVSCSEFEIV